MVYYYREFGLQKTKIEVQEVGFPPPFTYTGRYAKIGSTTFIVFCCGGDQKPPARGARSSSAIAILPPSLVFLR